MLITLSTRKHSQLQVANYLIIQHRLYTFAKWLYQQGYICLLGIDHLIGILLFLYIKYTNRTDHLLK